MQQRLGFASALLTLPDNRFLVCLLRLLIRTLTNGIFVISIYILGLIEGILDQIGIAISNNLINVGILCKPNVIYRQIVAAIFKYGNNTFSYTWNEYNSYSAKQMDECVRGIYLIGLVLLAVFNLRKNDIF
jgi:hypothetical protein